MPARRRIPGQPRHIVPSPTPSARSHRMHPQDKPLPGDRNRPACRFVLLPCPPPRPEPGTIRDPGQYHAHRTRQNRRTLRPTNRSNLVGTANAGLKFEPNQTVVDPQDNLIFSSSDPCAPWKALSGAFPVCRRPVHQAQRKTRLLNPRRKAPPRTAPERAAGKILLPSAPPPPKRPQTQMQLPARRRSRCGALTPQQRRQKNENQPDIDPATE